MSVVPKLVRVSALVAIAVLAAACATYNQVTDPQTGNVYYTDDLERNDSGGIEFTDSKTGNAVSLPSSEVREINVEEYKAHTPKQ